MKTAKTILAAAFMLLLATMAHAQLSIPGTRYTFALDSDEWRYLRTFKMDDGATTYLYCYVGEVLLDAAGDTVLPFLRIFVKDRYDDDLYQFVYERYEEQPYQSLREWTKGDGLPKSGGIGYEGMYTRIGEQTDYHFLMTYFRDKRTVVEFRLETTRETYEDMEVKFKNIISSVK